MATLFRFVLYILVFLTGWCFGRCEHVDPVAWLAGVFNYHG